ncbi:MAG: hypothetical protein RBU36_07475, partial [Thermoanaerobaculia bacterium]|nr:hypothetical protein [Thermoanaerobaculia bacterium]
MPHLRMPPRPAAGLVLPAALLAVLAATAPAAPAEEVKGRVVVLGFDGADHRLVSQMIAEGK